MENDICLDIDSGMRTFYHRRLNNGFSVEFFEEYTNTQSTEEERSIQRLKYCGKDEGITLAVNYKIV